MLRRLFPALFLLLLSALASTPAFADDRWEACPTTRPANPPFVPPSPYWSDAGRGAFWYGTHSLWTNLGAQGTCRCATMF